MNAQLELIDNLVAQGHSEFTFNDARQALGGSPSSTANALRRLRDQGLIERVIRGHYAIRPLGSLGTSLATENLSLAVATAFTGYTHRIAYFSALAEHGLLSHPVRTVHVACTHQVKISMVGRRPLKLVIEQPRTIHLESEPVGRSWRSTIERAIFECALRVDLAGSVDVLAEALVRGTPIADSSKIKDLGLAFRSRGVAGLRRLASLATALELPLDLGLVTQNQQPIIRLDPRDETTQWVDEKYRVSWNRTIDEIRAVVGN